MEIKYRGSRNFAPEPSGPKGPGARKIYRRPRLINYGDLRTLTLGGSPGMGDSGSTVMIRKPPAPP